MGRAVHGKSLGMKRMTNRGADQLRSCHRPDLRSLLARYEFGTLEDAERIDLESHLIECDACFGDLESGRIITEELVHHRVEYATMLREAEGEPRSSLIESLRGATRFLAFRPA